MREAFRRVCVEAKLVETRPGKEGENPKTSPRFTPHGLRHTYAALHLQHGTDVYYVSQQRGHASIELTVSTYGAWLKPNRRAPLTPSIGRSRPPLRRRREPDLQAKCERPATLLAAGRPTTCSA